MDTEAILAALRRKAATGAAGVSDGEYDPAEHTVADVKAHVEQHPDQADAVYELEQSGKGRATLLDWLATQGPE